MGRNLNLFYHEKVKKIERKKAEWVLTSLDLCLTFKKVFQIMLLHELNELVSLNFEQQKKNFSFESLVDY